MLVSVQKYVYVYDAVVIYAGTVRSIFYPLTAPHLPFYGLAQSEKVLRRDGTAVADHTVEKIRPAEPP